MSKYLREIDYKERRTASGWVATFTDFTGKRRTFARPDRDDLRMCCSAHLESQGMSLIHAARALRTRIGTVSPEAIKLLRGDGPLTAKKGDQPE